MTVADALAIYGEEHAPTVADPARIGYAIDALLPFWGNRSCADVKGSTTRLYAKHRGVSVGTVRRELGTLRAAMVYCGKEGYLTTVPMFPMPAAPETKQRAMTRSEVAKLLRVSPRHLRHFILVALYTGTRRDATLNLRLSGPTTTGGWFDLDAGILYRIGSGERATRKRRAPARIPRQLLAHARRWAARGDTWAVEWKGGRVGSVKTSWSHAVTDADLGWRPTPHTLKHTAITWAIQGGATKEDAAGFFSTSTETIERVYWHLSPDFQQGALDAIERNG
ncbi:integrase [Sedimentitalea sp. JM2-8]|uniref:Integrase n=1 Tax=Sedimentitalea xiamensis TaxID=3050037 RepID=A0ABT7FJ58_9RHOB|nr:integrase [Sedimentitalea xiamensis]MDK3075173.1 integrase [Sedimentitalea xiamensis]